MPLNIRQPNIPQPPNLLGMGGGTNNPLANQLTRERISGQQKQNALAVRGEQRAVAGEQRAGAKHEMNMQTKRFALQNSMMAAMIEQPDVENALRDDYEKQFGKFKITREGPEIRIKTDRGVIKGSAEEAANMHKDMSRFATQPNPQREEMDSIIEEYGRRGVSYEAPKKEEAPEVEKERLTIYGTKGRTKRIQVEKGKEYNPPEGWSLSKPLKDKRDTETTKQMGFKLAVSLRDLTHDKDSGEPLESVSPTMINALNDTAGEYGKEIVKVDLPEVEKGLFSFDLPTKSIYMVAKKGRNQITMDELKQILILDYDVSEKNADLYIKHLKEQNAD